MEPHCFQTFDSSNLILERMLKILKHMKFINTLFITERVVLEECAILTTTTPPPKNKQSLLIQNPISHMGKV